MESKKKPLILIVDDTTKNIQVLGNMLYSKGYNISVATSGKEALESVKAKTPDLILLDIQMPEMDGFEVCKNLKSNPSTKEIPVIFLTAVTDPEKIVHGFELGAVDYITKPLNPAELFMRVATHIEIKESRTKLEELNATKDKFFKIIAHDLRNPFAGIMGLSEIMENELKDNGKLNESTFLQYSQLIFNSAKSALSLIENLAQWAKSQTGEIVVSPRNLPFNNLLLNTLPIVTSNAFNKNIILEKNISDQDIVFADEALSNMIIRNLLTNAIKFTHPGGKIIVSTKMEGDFLEISISDTGIGISPKNLSKIFRIDSKFSSLGTNKEKGTGLGLILCQEFVEKQGGTIRVESELGKGSKFTFTLPLGKDFENNVL
ncbi:MAG: hybrid sensor histidine kinase/response regulator [Leptospiraceae bacterium]|jgi:two-component system sensor histidine kinase/response regulator|nr:hybrid sensor histidine kinase/response regulator [Leptospiraceae bacterium]